MIKFSLWTKTRSIHCNRYGFSGIKIIPPKKLDYDFQLYLQVVKLYLNIHSGTGEVVLGRMLAKSRKRLFSIKIK